ncbi:MAG: Ig-like domain-containing protein [Pseudomonadota bacterium]
MLTIAITAANVTNAGTGEVTYDYTATLLQPVTHPGNPNEDFVTLSNVFFTVTDSDNDPQSGSFNVTVTDDVPEAVAGPAMNVSENDGQTSGTGLLLNDAPGADGAKLTAVDFGLGNGFENIAATGTTTITNANGIYTFQANGTWTFDPAVQATTSNTTAGFTYRITDGDGDTSTATQTINVANANIVPVGGSVTAAVDDEGLKHGIVGDGTGVTGDDSTTSLSYATGTLTGSGGDGALNFTFANLNGVTGVTIGQETVSYSYASGRLVATITSAGRAGQILFTVDLNEATGAYTFNLINPIRHAGGNSENGDISLVLNYRVGDADADTSNDDTDLGSLTVNLDDDAPVTLTAQAMTIENGANAIGTGALNFYQSIGADGGSIAFSVADGTTLTSGGQSVTSGGKTVKLYKSDGGATLSGKIDLDGNSANGDETTVFTVKLNPNTSDQTLDTYTVQFLRALDDGSGSSVRTNNFDSTSSQNFKVAQGVNDDDILVSAVASPQPRVNGSNGNSVTLGAGGGTTIDSGELLRFDFATGVTVSAGGNNSITNATLAHYTTQGFSFVVENSGTSQILLRVFDANNDLNLTNDPQDTITHIFKNGVEIALGAAAPGGGYVVSAVNGDQFAIFTEDGYNRAEVAYSSGSSFAINSVGIQTFQNGTDKPLSFDLTLTDGDGDTSTGTLSVTATPLNNTINGTALSDLLVAGIGGQTVNGQAGDDVLIGGPGADTLNGGAHGTVGDIVSYQNSAAAVQVNLLAGTATGGDAAGDILSGIENLTGSAFGDTLTGDGNANVLIGLGGNDTLNGGGGNDTLIGGPGQDTLIGDTGADTFVLTDTASFDIIQDYNAGESDKIDLTALFTVAAGHSVTEYVSRSGSDLFVDIDGNLGGAVAVKVAQFTANPAAGTLAVIYEDANHAVQTATF